MSEYDLGTLKRFVAKNYPTDHPLQILQEEQDIIHDKVELLAKIETWLRLSHK